VNTDGDGTWEAAADPMFGGVWTSASGTGAKDDRLVSAPFGVTADTRLGFRHNVDVEPNFDGGVLEVTADGGSTWEQIESDRFVVGSYDGELPDGRPSWTGLGPLHESQTFEPTSMYWTGADLSGYAGQTVQVRWRLLMDALRPTSAPGIRWHLVQVRLSDVIVGPCAAADTPASSFCNSLDPPRAVGLRGVTDDGSSVRLDVRVALDVEEGAAIAVAEREGRTAEAAAAMDELTTETAALLAPAQRAYSALGIDIALTYELLAPLDAEGNPRERSAVDPPVISGPNADPYYEELFALARQQYGGAVPADADVVYVATDLPLEGPAGVADCVGGSFSPKHAFAVGHLYRGRQSGNIGPVRLVSGEAGARVFGHEVGHLLGAQHHLSNCAESASEWLPQLDASGACTLMSPDIGTTWLRFSTVNGAIVRGHADAYARDNDG
jgi:hypothetical protein